MFGLLKGITLAFSAFIVVGAAALGALSWFIAKLAPKSADAMFAASLLLALMAIPLGISVLVNTFSGDWVGPLDPIYTVGVPGACAFLALAPWGIWRISRGSGSDKRAL